MIASLIAFFGCILVSGIISVFQQRISVSGILYGIGAGSGYALYSVFGTILLKKNYEPETVSVFTFIFAAIGAFFLAGVKIETIKHIANSGGVGAAFGIGVVCSMVPFTLYTKGLKQISASKASIVASLEPAVAAIAGLAFFEEHLDGIKLAGICLILLGIMLIGSEK